MSFHAIGVIIMLVGAVALTILLVRSVGGSHRRSRPRRRPVGPVARPFQPIRDPDGSYLPLGGALSVAATHSTAEVDPTPGRQANEPPPATTTYRTPRPQQR